MLSGFCETESFQLCIICKIIYLAVFIELVKEVNKMKTVSLFLLIITTILVSTALAAPTLYMYSLNETDCRVCHNDANILRNTNHNSSHDGTEYSGTELHDDSESCSECHAENAQKKLDCMVAGCHADPANPVDPDDPNNVNTIGVENHHELEVESCLICHEKGVPRGK